MLFAETKFMKPLSLLLLLIVLQSCIPLRIAPKIETDKVVKGKKFKRKLPKDYAFIFEDPKDANEFYNYVNTKYGLNHNDVEWNVPFDIDGNTFYFSFYEVEIPTKTINFLPVLVDAALDNNDFDPMFQEHYSSRVGYWYLAITVSDDNFNDCLKPNYQHRAKVLNYLRALKAEYLQTHNYLEVQLKQ
ncbi:hypothetical protein MHTCC0001_01070 [Flavobacteriaceae bacterium MHTCC 0001]